jgi:hypothetical protein
MKKLLSILALVLLPGCAVIDSYLMKYDGGEYQIITEIRHDASVYKQECANPLMSMTNSIALSRKTEFYVMYAEHTPHDKEVFASAKSLNDIAQGLSDQYTKSDKVSPLFCKIKFETIEHSAETMQKIIGAKPR